MAQPEPQPQTISCMKYLGMTIVSYSITGVFCVGIAALCWMLFFRSPSDSETVMRSLASPDGRITARVISERCGDECCALRIDLETAERTLTDAHRSTSVCDAALEWEGSNLLLIRDATGSETWLNMRELGL